MRAHIALLGLLLGYGLASACSSSEPASTTTSSHATTVATTGAGGHGSSGTGGAGGGGDHGGAGGKGGAATLDAKTFEGELAKLTCKFEARCGFIAKAEEAACEAAVDAGGPVEYATSDASAAGRLHYDAATAAKCLDRMKTLGCTAEQQVEVGRICDSAFSAAVMSGGDCQARPECVGGYCDRAKYARDGCPGKCASFLANGDACDPNENHCATTSYCDSTTKQCMARGNAGAACGVDGPFCNDGFFCIAGKCTGQGALGDTCVFGVFGSSCTPGLFCKDGSPSPKCAARSGSGTACESFEACDDGLDCIDLVFDPNSGAVTKAGTCGPYLDVASACDPKKTESGCPGGTACDVATKACATVGAEGSACGGPSDPDCRDGLYCNAKKCAPRLPIGSVCTPPAAGDPNPCEAGTQCNAGSATCALICQ
jgi:hypothetical protein